MSSGNVQLSAIDKILGGASQAVSSASAYASSTVSTYASEENGNFMLKVLFYLLMYAFVLFLVMVLVNYSFTPIFKFSPGGAGILSIPAMNDSAVYWNNGLTPPEARVPLEKDTLASYAFENNFSLSVDLYIRSLPSTTSNNKRLILYKTYQYGNISLATSTVAAPANSVAGSAEAVAAAAAAQTTYGTSPISVPPASADILQDLLKGNTSMALYLNATNDLIVEFYIQKTAAVAATPAVVGVPAVVKPYACRPIKNIPLYTPFRITVVVEDKSFSVYLNAKLTFQRTIPITTNIVKNEAAIVQGAPATESNTKSTNQRFYTPSSQYTGSEIFTQNLILWPRAISYSEVQKAQPSLASVEQFGAPPDPSASAGNCS
jgi:hypothetical protein